MVAKSLVALAASTVVAAVVLSAAASWGVASMELPARLEQEA